MESRRKVALIGLGMAATAHAKALKDLASRVDVAGVYARDPQRRHLFAQRFGFPEAPDVASIVDDPAIHAVLLLTPPDARQDLVDRLSAAGKHILMEKPVERTTDAAERVVALCEARGVRLGIVLQHRFRAGSMHLRGLLDDGALGAVAAVQVSVPWWRPQSYYDEPGRGTLARDGGGVLISQAIHSLDLMTSLAGAVAEVQAVAGTTRLHRMETEDFVGAGLRFESGALGAFTATTAAYPGGGERLTILCEKATATLDAAQLTLSWQDGTVERIGEPAATGGGADPMAFPHDWHRLLIADFLDALDQDREPAVTGRQALAVHHLIDALLLSAGARRAVAPAQRQPLTTW